MEIKPNGTNPFETPSESVDKKKEKKDTSKKKFLPELTSKDDRKQQAEKRIAQSIDELFSRTDAKNETSDEDTPRDEAEPPVEQLNDEETRYIEQAVAREHLATLEDADTETREQLELASDFLERVSNGTDIDTAFEEVLADHELEDAPGELDATMPDFEPAQIDADEAVDLHSGGTSIPSPENNTPDAANTYYAERANRGSDLLLGGIVGYLIGRRRGRIKTEKRLLPVQKKLESQVRNLEKDIEQKERRLVAIKASQSKERREAAAAKQQAITERRQPGLQETRLGMEKPARAEHLGHMMVAAQSPNTERVRIERPGNIRAAYRAEEIKTMNRNQMLELSEKITVEGASLRHMYESNLIGERQLRHLVAEYLDGKDIRDELRRHVVEHEIDFERDPILRDRIRGLNSPKATGGGMLTDLLVGAGLVSEEKDPVLEHRLKADAEKAAIEERRHQRQRLVTDTAMATAIIVLAVAVIVLAVHN